MKIKQLLTANNLDFDNIGANEEHLLTVLTEDNRIFIGGMIDSGVWRWIEVPAPKPENTHALPQSA